MIRNVMRRHRIRRFLATWIGRLPTWAWRCTPRRLKVFAFLWSDD